MKTLLIAVAAAGALAVAGGAAAAGADVFNAKCASCHAQDTKKMGPSVKDIQAKGLKADDVVAKLKDGKGHPKVNAPEGDIKSAVDFALTGK